MNKYYIYIYLDQNNIPFYVGKGKDKRYEVSGHLYKNNYNNLLKNKIRKVGIDNIQVRFLHKNLTENEALQKEVYWIKYYGRRDLKQGTLCNLTNGGEGTTGIIVSKEHRRKIGKIHKGKNLSEEHKQKISEFHKGRKRSEKTKRKMRKALKDKPVWNKGKHLSEEYKQKISKANKGKPSWNKGKKLGSPSIEHKRKISEALQGRKLSIEHKSKLCRGHEVLQGGTIRKIRELYKLKISQHQIANIFNILQSTISNIVNYKTYKHIK